MANYELHLFRKILDHKTPDSVVKAIFEESGQSSDIFLVYGDEFDKLLAHRRKYKKFPDKKVFEEMFPEIVLPKVTEPLKYYLDEVKKAYLFNEMSDVNELLVKHLKDGKPAEAYKETLGKLHGMQGVRSASTDLNLSTSYEDRIKAYDFRRSSPAITGIPTGWNMLDAETCGWQESEVIYLFGRMKSFKCVDIDSRVRLMDGTIKTLRYCLDKGIDRIHSYDEISGKMVVSVVKSIIKTGNKDAVCVTTASGRVTRVSLDHPYLTDSGWVKAGKLSVGNRIAIPSVTRFSFENYVEYDKAYFLGLMISEGGLTKGEPIFSSADREVLEWAENFALKEGLSLNMVSKYTYRFSGNYKGNVTREWLKEFGLSGLNSWNKRIPDVAMAWNLDSKSVLIKGLFDGDGSVTALGGLVYTTVSEELAYQLSSIFLEFGIVSSVNYYKYGVISFWRVSIYRGYSEKFYVSIPKLIGVKNSKLEAALAIEPTRLHIDSLEVPEELRDALRRIISMYSPTRLGRELGWIKKPNFGFLRGKQKITRVQLRRILSILRKEDLIPKALDTAFSHLLDREIFMDKVIRIDSVSDLGMVDLAIEGTHNFVVENTLVHNSWVMLSWAVYSWEQGFTPLFFSREMGNTQLSRRIDTLVGKTRFKDVKTGTIDDKGFKKFADALRSKFKGKHPFVLIDSSESRNYDVDFIASKIQAYKPDVIYVDGVYMLRGSGNSDWEKQTTVSRGLKQLAIAEKIPLIGTTQANRGGATQKGKLRAQNIAYSDAYGQDADYLIGLNRRYDKINDRWTNEILVDMPAARESIEVKMYIKVDLDAMSITEMANQVAGVSDVPEYEDEDSEESLI
jgi:intein/homing endonuclease